MEQQPFYIGQKVVCVKDSDLQDFVGNLPPEIKKDVVYKTTVVRKSLVFPDLWVVGLEGVIGLYHSALFAPLNPPRVSAIPELLKAPVEERVDHHQPVKVLTKDG